MDRVGQNVEVHNGCCSREASLRFWVRGAGDWPYLRKQSTYETESVGGSTLLFLFLLRLGRVTMRTLLLASMFWSSVGFSLCSIVGGQRATPSAVTAATQHTAFVI